MLIGDPDGRYVDAYDSDGDYERLDASRETYVPGIIPSLAFPLHSVFAELDAFDNVDSD